MIKSSRTQYTNLLILISDELSVGKTFKLIYLKKSELFLYLNTSNYKIKVMYSIVALIIAREISHLIHNNGKLFTRIQLNFRRSLYEKNS